MTMNNVFFPPEKAIINLERTAHILRAIVENMTAKQSIVLRDGPDGWNSVEIICHMADFDHIFLTRMKDAVSKDNPTFRVYDVPGRVISENYGGRKIGEALSWFITNRNEMVEWLKTVTPEQFERIGQHPENGQMTVREIAYNTILHDINHIEQILKAIGRLHA
ncbi:MAG: DinB family protein [Pleurocapsa minor GSE-CHR-MK-17-07R]|jgi:uncharacterized damage-inducible protein DinB|nr:DinB family protein [Pleurocapsa minor GSE-CHR-MK 17-07R]